MIKYFLLPLVILTGVLVAPAPGRAEEAQLSPQRLDVLDRRGYFTPTFKAAVHDLVNAKKAVVDAKKEEKTLNSELPDLEKQLADAEAKVADLRKQSDSLDHFDESEFIALQKTMTDPNAKLEDQRVLAQAYVWGYPKSSHVTEAQNYLTATQTKIADEAKAAADAEAARVAAHAKLVQRAQAKDLKINEWRDLLLSMSKEELLKFLGAPQYVTEDDWVYAGGWTLDDVSQQKVGIDVSFSGGRVNNVTQATR